MSDEEQFRGFPLTRWSLINRAGGAARDDPQTRAALEELVRRYLPALRAHLVLTRRLNPDDADERLQEFLASKVLEQQLIGRADRASGKFRTFLLASLRNFLIDHHRASSAAKRASARAVTAIDEQIVDQDQQQPGSAYELAWARQVIERATDLMRQECSRQQRDDLWGAFESRILRPALEGAEPIDYAQLVARYGWKSPEQASNALVTAKRMFLRTLRWAVSEYAEDADVEDELRELKQVLSRGLRG